MKRLALLLCFVLSVSNAGGQQPPAPPPPPPAAPTIAMIAQPAVPVTVCRGNTDYRFRAYGINQEDPVGNAEAARAAFAFAKPGDLILLRAVTFDFGKTQHVIFPDGVTIRGMGRDQTKLLSQVVSDDLGTSFALQNTIVEDLSLTNDCANPGEDGRCVGFDNGAFGVGPGPFTAIIRRCRCWCRDWTVYNWSANNVLLVEDCEVFTGRVGIAAENSGDGQDFEIVRTKIFGDASLSKSQGATSKRGNGGCFGAVCRGGRISFIDCSMQLKGQPLAPQDAAGSWTPRICGIVDRGGAGDPAAGNTRIEVYNLRSSIDPNGADPARCFDLDLEFDYVRKQLRCNSANCWGSAGDGSLSKRF